MILAAAVLSFCFLALGGIAAVAWIAWNLSKDTDNDGSYFVGVVALIAVGGILATAYEKIDAVVTPVLSAIK